MKLKLILAFSISLGLICLVWIKFDGLSIQSNSNSSIATLKKVANVFLNQHQYKAYQDVINFNFKNLKYQSELELLKKNNFFTYNFCITGKSKQSSVPNLFLEPYTACGGCTFIFRAIAEYYDIETRYAYLYNIPHQGNHSLVEAKTRKGKWVLFDPTFGLFFTSDGQVDSNIYGLSEINYELFDKPLIDYVIKAKKVYVSKEKLAKFLRNSTSELYTPKFFNEKYMDLNSYVNSERYGYNDSNLETYLRIQIDMINDYLMIGTDFKTLAEGEAGFLQASNSSLNDANKLNDFSYLASTIGKNAVFQNVIIEFINLKPSAKYTLTIKGIVNSKAGLQKLFSDKGGILKSIEPIQISKGIYSEDIEFIAKKEQANLLLSIYPANSPVQVRLFTIISKKI